MNTLYRIFLTISSLLFALEVFLISSPKKIFSEYPLIYLFVICTVITILVSIFSLFLARYLDEDKISESDIECLEPANNNFLPSYLGYFLAALSINEIQIFCYVFLIISVLVFFARESYFNPVYLILGYKFYNVTTRKKAKLLIISRQQLKLPKDANFSSLKRINDVTFIDLKGKN
jgi:magnesium-transporting ATPase (P-type)